MRSIDKQEYHIVEELIKNPRISDNQITKNTGIPLKTVNRKRKKLEEEGLLQYYTSLDTSFQGTGDFGARQMYIVSFKHGITRKHFFEGLSTTKIQHIVRKHVLESHLGEDDGRLVLILVLESRIESDIIEIFNHEFVPLLKSTFGGDCITKVQTISLSFVLRLLHNYIPQKNILNGLNRDYAQHRDVFVVDNDYREFDKSTNK